MMPAPMGKYLSLARHFWLCRNVKEDWGIMHHIGLRMRMAVCLLGLGLSGCINAQNTRLPTLAYGDPRAERQAFTAHDPLPESDIGPPVSDRPRGFELARSEPRRALEHSPRGRAQMNSRIAPVDPAAPAANDSAYLPSPADNYPQSVRP